MKILVTGGAGYIGSHTCVELIERGYDILVIDNLMNSCKESLKRVEEITGKKVEFIELDLLDMDAVTSLFKQNTIDAVIHFAGLKAVGESVEVPLSYYHNNVTGTLHLAEAMKASGVKNIVFSSSATVYGDPHAVPIKEDFPVSPTNPYGRTKLMIEDIFKDLFLSDKSWNIMLLRYFNPVGAHQSGKIGEDPNGIPNNLMPYVSHVAVGKLAELSVFGSDYPTSDGTGVRDYIHVVDLAKGHISAVEKIKTSPGLLTCNLGTGRGYSVLEMVDAFEKISGRKIQYKVVDRRPGDIATCYADPSFALQELGWSAEFGIEDMCRDSWNWQSKNPEGFKS